MKARESAERTRQAARRSGAASFSAYVTAALEEKVKHRIVTSDPADILALDPKAQVIAV